MAKYKNVKQRKIGNSNSVTIPKNPYTNHIKQYTPYISHDGTIVLKPHHNHKPHRHNPWKSQFYQHYDFNKDMKSDPDAKPLSIRLGAKYK